MWHRDAPVEAAGQADKELRDRAVERLKKEITEDEIREEQERLRGS